jgi:hypothetical protein
VIKAVDAVVEAVRRGDTRLRPGALAGTGATSWILVVVASFLVGLGVVLNASSRRGVDQQHAAWRHAGTSSGRAVRSLGR